MTMKPLRPLLALLVAAFLPASAAAQLDATVAAGATLETYRFGEAEATGLEEVTLLTLPFGASVRPVRWARLEVGGAYASGSVVRSDGAELSLSGLTDTSLRLAFPVARDRLTVGAAVILPTGRSSYDMEEAQVAGIIAADLLPFRITNWGSGGAIDLSSSFAGTTGSVNLGGRVGFQMAREFDLVEQGGFAYRPGNQLYLRLGADGSIGDGRAAAQVTIYRFGEDQVNSQNLYRSGNRLEGLLSYTMPMGRRGRAAAYVGALHRQHGVFLDGTEDSPAQTLLLLGGGLRQPFRYGILVPSVDVRLLRRSDGADQGYIVGAGTSVEIPVAAGSATLLPRARIRFGRVLVRSGVESGLTGVELGAALRFGELAP